MLMDPSKEPALVGTDFCKFFYYPGYSDMALCEIGSCKCKPGYSYGPVVRNQNIFHYVVSGRGKLVINNTTYEVGPKHGFLIPDEVLAYYEADKEDPWHYQWIHVDGVKANEAFQRAGITKNHPIFTPSSDMGAFEELLNDLFNRYEDEYYCMAKTYEILDFIISHSTNKVEPHVNRQLEYVQTIIRWIQLNFSEQFRIEDLADLFGLNRSYMTRLFKEATGRTMQDYILSCRMAEAKRYLSSTEYPVQFISCAVGYGDTFTFSKAFKRFVGVSPSEFREASK